MQFPSFHLNGNNPEKITLGIIYADVPILSDKIYHFKSGTIIQ